MDLTVSEKVVHCVVPLEKLNSAGTTIGLATGFIMGYCEQTDGRYIPMIVTNRHVLQNCDSIRTTFTVQRSDGSPDLGHTVSVSTPQSHFFFHPNSSIDLGCFPFPLSGPNGERLFFSFLQMNLIPTDSDWNSFDAIESVTMAGYPKGLRDTVNNFPIVRRGITATPLNVNFEGAPTFLVDMPCFEGCSGSPVFLLNEGGFIDTRTQCFNLGQSRIFLLGVQYAIPRSQSVGELKLIPSGAPELRPVTQTYLSIGHVIKSSALLDFEPIIRAQMRPWTIKCK